MKTKSPTLKKVAAITEPGRATHWVGDGFAVRSLFAYDEEPEATSPFLLLDYAAPRHFAPSTHQRGVGEHPHRGFETVTIAYQGEIEHRDSTGAGGKIAAGSVQWMTAASGIVHEELFGKDFARSGGTLEMVQLWVNLPARFKMSKPGYQDLAASKIPTVTLADGAGTARVIAGELDGTKGPARTFTPVDLWDLRLAAGSTFRADVPSGRTTMLLVLDGEVAVGGATVGAGQLIRFEREGEQVSVAVKTATKALLLSGEPIDEPVVGRGPFVMNTEEEIYRAFLDYQRGAMGHLDGGP